MGYKIRVFSVLSIIFCVVFHPIYNIGLSYVVIGDNFSDITLERHLFDVFKGYNLSERIANIESLRYKDRVIVGITFFYGIYYTNDKEKVYQDLMDYSKRLTKVTFHTFPYISELDLSGIYKDKNKLEDNYKEPTFTASIYRKDFENLYRENEVFDLFLNKIGRVYYSDALLLNDLSNLKKESYVRENSNRKVGASSKGLLNKFRDIWLSYRRTRVGGIYKNTISRGNPHLKEISITFDDGPRPVYTPIILNILDSYSVKATFFLIGKRAQLYHYFVRDLVESGHAIGNHTMHHLNLIELPYEKKVSEILEAQDVLYGITGEKCRYFRPPGGDYDKDVEEILKKNSMYLVLWTKKLGDYLVPEKDSKILLEKVKKDVVPGSIIVFHVGVKSTVEILPEFLDYVKKEGYKIVPLDKLIEDARYRSFLQNHLIKITPF